MASRFSTTRAHWRRIKKFLDGDSPLAWIVNLLIAFILIKFLVYPALGWAFGTSLPVVAVVSSSMDHSIIDGNVCGFNSPADYHGSFDDYWNVCGGWYETHGISKDIFRNYSFTGGFNKGDIMVILGPSRTNIKQGDVIVFSAGEGQDYPIIHRVISVNKTSSGLVYQTKGDHNIDQIIEYVLFDSTGTPSDCQRNGAPVPCYLGSPVTRETPGSVMVVDETNIPQDAIVGKAVARIPLLGWVKIWFTDIVGLFH